MSGSTQGISTPPGVTQHVISALCNRWNEVKGQVVAQIAANILAGNAGNTQIAQQAQALQMQYNTLSEIFEQASNCQQELMDLYKKGCFNSQVTFFGSSFAETLAWMAALGLGISFAVDQKESDEEINAMGGLSIVLFVLSQGISKFNDYQNFKKIDELKRAQKNIKNLQDLLQQKHLLDTTLKVVKQANTLVGSSCRNLEKSTEENDIKWNELQRELKDVFDPPFHNHWMSSVELTGFGETTAQESII